MSPSVVRQTIEYFDDFYDQVKSQKDAESNIFRKCIRPN